MTVATLSQGVLRDHVAALYGAEHSDAVCERLDALLDTYRPLLADRGALSVHAALTAGARGGITERDTILITYPDAVREPGVLPLRSLTAFCLHHLRNLVTGIHLLPFYPSSSDDGFAVIDYRSVDPEFGDWSDVARLGSHFRLMFDAVLNHVSTQSSWFQQFLRDDPRYRGYFIVVPDGTDLSAVVRPRALPLLTRFSTISGPKALWTTFSADQVDLNYGNPEVLLQAIETVLFYVAHGASLIRLDAIAYLWKEFGTSCIHLPQTHHIVQLLRLLLDAVAPYAALVTETNVRHEENVSYFGDGTNEAQMVYNFALPPLVLHAFHTGSADALSRWAAGLRLPSSRVTFLNFLASHDGIGLSPARGILSEAEVQALVQRTVAHGGLVSHRGSATGAPSPYELNINYFDALSSPYAGESLGVQVDRFIAAHAIMLSLAGVPGIYFHSLFGSRGWAVGPALTGHNRAINRQKLLRPELEAELGRPASLRQQVFERLAGLLRVRAGHPAFDPHGSQRVLASREPVFALLRASRLGTERVLCLHNVSGVAQRVGTSLRATLGSGQGVDLISGRRFASGIRGPLLLEPYGVLWIQRR
jgi:glycosidase